ncbi:g4088 [Coccomyxa elongata]
MSALMGPSGSGKTTLLDVLAGRKTAGKTQGTILFAGVKPSSMFLRRYTGYVEQFDTLVDVLTVEEMLLYTAQLKRPLREDHASKSAAVDTLIHDLGLEGCRNTLIGNSMNRGISGGQACCHSSHSLKNGCLHPKHGCGMWRAKRTNIGIAMITNPRVLFLDEPTSGLDSYTSNEVMTVVKQLVKSGITVCATIHSPTPYAFRLFDRMMLLLRGRVVYFGPRGNEAVEYFKAAPLPEGQMMTSLAEGANEAEWIVDITTQADRQQRGGMFADMYEASALKAANDEELDGMLKQNSSVNPATLKELSVKRATVTPFWWALWIMFRFRTAKNYKNGAFLGPRVGDKMIFSLLIFTLYFAIGKNFNPDNLINISAVLFMWSTLPAFGAAAYIPAIVLERPLFTRERNDGLYRVITYLVSKMLEELILAFVASLIFSCIVFYGVRLQGEWVLFWLVYLVTLSCGIVLAYTVAACAPNMDVANAALPAYVVTLLFFAGFLLRSDSMPRYWFWYQYLDFIRYGWHAQMGNQFEGNRDVLLNGKPILEFYDINYSKWANLGFESIFFLGFFVLAWLALSFCKHSRR